MTENTWSIDRLTNWDKNPREINPDDFLRLKRQITRLGKYKPLLITSDGVVIGGNMRLKALKELNQTEVKTTVIAFVETDGGYYATIDGQREGNAIFKTIEAGLVEYALSDNDRAGYYVEDKLADLIASVPDLELETYKVDFGKLTSLEDVLAKYATDEKEDDVPPVDAVNVVSMPGEIYQLGKHRLMCGDATNLDQVKLLMNDQKSDMIFTDPPYNVDYTGKTKDALKIENDQKSDMIFTDPPYNVDYTGKTKDALKIENDQKSDTDFYQFLYDSFVNMHSYSKSGASIYVCHADTEAVNFREAFAEAGFILKQVIIWNKNVFVMGRQDYQWKHEPILYGWKEGESHQFYGGRDQTTVWDIERPFKSEEHPTMKPVKLVAKAILNNSKGDDIVMDLFGGSGSTLIACEETKRACYTMEIDPKYCDVIRKRYATFINKEAEWEAVTPAINVKTDTENSENIANNINTL